jgi:hypothetical protein
MQDAAEGLVAIPDDAARSSHLAARPGTIPCRGARRGAGAFFTVLLAFSALAEAVREAARSTFSVLADTGNGPRALDVVAPTSARAALERPDAGVNHCAHPFMNLYEGNMGTRISGDDIPAKVRFDSLPGR